MPIKVPFYFIILLLVSGILLITQQAAAQERAMVGGSVQTIHRDPVSKVTVVAVNTKDGTIQFMTTTDSAGNFRLSNMAPLGRYRIQFSYVGYKDYEVTRDLVAGTNRDVDVVLKLDSLVMEDVVVTGFQNAAKKTFSGASTRLKMSDVKQDGVIDISRFLEGRVAGVSVQNVSGTFGSAPKIRVRGATSITGDNKPLWVVDGVVLEDVVNVTNDQLSSGDPSTLFGSSVAGLSSDDIESFEILKDAAATSYYGAKAMNGVIVVTTKKGRVGKPQISYSGNFSVSLKPSYRNYNIMNSNEQMSVYNELYNLGWFTLGNKYTDMEGGPWEKMYAKMDAYNSETDTYELQNSVAAYRKFLDKYRYVNTNWFNELFRNALLQEHSVGVSTGTEKAQFYVSSSFVNDGGWYLGSGVNRFTGNARGTFTPNPRISFGISAVGSIRRQKAPGTYGRTTDLNKGTYSRDFDINPFSYALNASRSTPLFDENGNREYFKRYLAPFNILTELEENRLKIGVNDFKLQGDFSYFLTANRELKYSFLGAVRSVKASSEHEITTYSNVAQAYRVNSPSITATVNKLLYRDPNNPSALPRVILPYGGFYNPSDNDLLTYTFRNNLEWNKDIHNKTHSINVFTSQEYINTTRQTRDMLGYGYMYDKGGIAFINPEAIKKGTESGLSYYNRFSLIDHAIGLLGRVTYAYKQKYVFNGTLRYDGSNKLGSTSQARWLPTWNISGAWNIDEENFMKDQNLVNYMKLRATYGMVASLGNADNASVVYKTLLSARPVASEQETVFDLRGLTNSELTWEKQYELNVGMDINFLNNKYTLVIDGYSRKGMDLISAIRTSGIGGQDVKMANYADMNTKGFEFTLGANFIKNEIWNFNSRLTFGYNKSKVIRLVSPANIFTLVRPEGGTVVGGPYRGLYSVVMTGLDHYFGYPTFLDHFGNKNSTNVYLGSENTQYLKFEGQVDPIYTGGLFNSLRYKQFSFSALLSYQVGNKIRLDPAFTTNYSQLQNTPRDLVDRWVLPGDEKLTHVPGLLNGATLGKFNGDRPYDTYNYSQYRVLDGSFIRLKTITLSYQMSPRFVKRMGLGSASLSCTGNSLWLLYSDKNLKGQDPEFYNSGGVASPVVKQVTMALKIGF